MHSKITCKFRQTTHELRLTTYFSKNFREMVDYSQVRLKLELSGTIAAYCSYLFAGYPFYSQH